MNGILIVDKPKGWTSHDVVSFIRKRFALEKVGHAGTLDPIATGVLVMLIGKCTKESASFTADDKEYEATLVLGATSDTGDAFGRINYSDKRIDFDRSGIEEVFKRFSGDIEQSPPMYSAVKFKGRKLYELARKGMSVKTEPRKVSIKQLEILKILPPEIFFKVTCSKGTYIRQLCVDIGKALGCGGHMSGLRRTRSGKFTIDEAVSVDELKKTEKENLAKKLYSL